MWKVIVVLLFACRSGVLAAPPEPDYATIREKLEQQRVALAAELSSHRKQTIKRARAVLIESLRDKILPAWNGTEWAMGGTSQVPHEGQIACGYFISTTLLHMGFEVERARMGQQASEFITRSLVTEEPIWQTSKQPIEDFIARLSKGGQGIYLVGLDNHVGFVIIDEDGTWFHHSGPGDGVRREPALTASFLSTSRYRQAAKLFDDALVEKWLLGTSIKTVLPKRQGS